jgi:uncharacterized Zn finger protein (UPF0148 family)
MKIICGSCGWTVWLKKEDLGRVDVDAENELVCPFCSNQEMRAALSETERRKQQDKAEWGVFD